MQGPKIGIRGFVEAEEVFRAAGKINLPLLIDGIVIRIKEVKPGKIRRRREERQLMQSLHSCQRLQCVLPLCSLAMWNSLLELNKSEQSSGQDLGLNLWVSTH